MKLLMIDNYDSFTYNLVHRLGELGAACEVVRNDVEPLGDMLARKADGLIISPGPCSPSEAGHSLELVKSWPARKPLLGVCLGHQTLAMAFGWASSTRQPASPWQGGSR
jgi:Anthranilate/para-aminobenzoate synthases component II